jgi:4'-phosphopantetheinyl transferase
MWLALDSVARCAAAWQRDRSQCVDECERAARIATELRRAQFLAGRWLAASMLAERFGGANAAWHMSCEAGQAPRVLSGSIDATPHLSISHRGDAVACAISTQRIGVDVEVEDRLHGPAEGYAELALHVHERVELEHLASASRKSFVLERWVLKEAWAKAVGRGLDLSDMPNLKTQATAEGGNARLWRAGGQLLALCVEAPGTWPQPAGGGFDAAAAECWHVGESLG